MIVEQYDRLGLSHKEYYDVTLLLNACVGLLFVAEQKYQSDFPKNDSPEMLRKWGIHPRYIKLCKSDRLRDQPTTVYTICRHIRNSIAHINFAMKCDDGMIDILAFYDYAEGNTDKPVFIAEIPVSDFKTFTMAVSNHILMKEGVRNGQYL